MSHESQNVTDVRHTDTEAYTEAETKTPRKKDGVGFAIGVLQQLEIPSSPMLMRLVGAAINFRCQQTGNPEETEADFIIAQARDWMRSPNGSKNPRMGWPSWFQGAHYNDDPATWQSTARKTRSQETNEAIFGHGNDSAL